MGLKLFDGDEEADNVNLSEIKIDEEFARRYEHNKKREDLQRYGELKKKGLIEDSESESESESSSEEEDPSIANRNRKHDIEFFKVLNQVRNQDPRIYQKDVTFFEPESDNDNKEEEGEVKEKKKKHEHLKDIQARMLIEEGPEFDDTEPIMEKKSYHEEQEELKKAFLDAVKEDENDDEDIFLKVKDKSENQESEDDVGEFEKKLDEYFGKEEQLDENSKYLKEFFMKKMWLDKEGKDKTSFVDDDDDMDELMEDEEEIERQEKYEESYNFRHEEGVGDRVMGHSRKVEGSVRKKDNARKEQRKNKEERQKVAEMERKEELKHLKNLKKKEMKEKMKKVLEAAGMKSNYDCPLDLDDLEDDFDPEEYDKMMKAAFGQKYYDTEDVDPSFGDSDDDEGYIEKPDFDKEDELLGLPKGWDVPEEGDGFLAARDRVLKRKAENGDEHDEQSVEGEDNREENSKQSGGKRKRKMSFFKKVKEELMEEYYKLDYEDTIGDLKTRFKYAKVEPKRYGLKAEDILTLDDKELNQYVSIKKLAPYREMEWKVPKIKRHMFIKSKLLMAKQYNSKTDKRKKRPKHVEDKSASVSDSDRGRKAEMEESELSKSAKRRRRQAQVKLSNSRLRAYGKIEQKSKGKGKQ